MIPVQSSALRDWLATLTDKARQSVSAGEAPLAVMRALVKPLPCAALVADDDGRFVVANREAAALTGYSNAELLRLSVWEITPYAREREAETLWRAFVQMREQSGEYRVCAKNGSTLTLEYAARAHVLPVLHVSLLRRPPDVSSGA